MKLYKIVLKPKKDKGYAVIRVMARSEAESLRFVDIKRADIESINLVKNKHEVV